MPTPKPVNGNDPPDEAVAPLPPELSVAPAVGADAEPDPPPLPPDAVAPLEPPPAPADVVPVAAGPFEPVLDADEENVMLAEP